MGSVCIKNLSIDYGGRTIIHDLTFSVNNGEIASLLGPSGAGKTTILKAIAGLLKPRTGSIAINGKSVTSLKAEQRDAVMIFQKPLLFPFLNVAENIGFGLKMSGISGRAAHEKISRIIGITGLAGLDKRKIHQLSGGQQQRVALARGLVLEPSILLLDEPLSNLDAELRQQMRDLILEVHARTGTTMLFVTHDQSEALTISNRIFFLLDGSLRQSGPPDQLFYKPADPDVARFFGCTNFIYGAICNTVFSSEIVTCSTQLPDRTQATAFIRPEDITLSAEPCQSSVPGEVITTRFEGSVSRILIRLGNIDFTVLAVRPDLVPGQIVHASFPPSRIHIFSTSDDN